MSTEQPEAPALPFAPPPDCDAAEWGGAATVYGGRCRCIVCARCGHHVANSAQGHHWDWCTVTRSMRVPHFCCPDPAFGCELEAPAPEPLIMAADEFAATRKVAEALTAVGRGLELAAPFHDADRQIIAAARQALRVLGGEEADAGPGEAIVETMGPLPVAALDREHVQDLIAAALDESVGRCARCKSFLVIPGVTYPRDELESALLAAAPLIRAAERERIAARMDELAANYPEDVFPPDSDVRDAIGGTAMRHAYRNAAREVREADHG